MSGEGNDFRVWALDPHGIFSVKSFCRKLMWTVVPLGYSRAIGKVRHLFGLKCLGG